jgi:hypothetical protein
MGDALRLGITEDDADAERLDALTSYLRAELAELDVEDVAARPAGPAPPGARSGAIAAAGGLLVSLSQAADSLTSVVSAVRAWLGRGDNTPRTVRLELDGDVLELARPTPDDQERLIELFISRHRPGAGG